MAQSTQSGGSNNHNYRSVVDDPLSPFYLHHSDSPGLVLVSQLLTGDNHAAWCRAMTIALSVKNKLGFVDNSIQRPDNSDTNQLNSWIRNNNMVISWILNSVSKEISASIIFADSAQEIWLDLKDRFRQSNGPRIFQLRRELINHCQGQTSIRSHAQKYFLKVQKNGKTEHVPPPRPKRKASHPYPQKAPKNVSAVSQATGALKSSSALLDSGHAARPDPLLGSRNPVCSAPLSPWTYNVVPTGTISHTSKDDTEAVGFSLTQNCSGSKNDSTLRTWKSDRINYQGKGNQCQAVRVMPDFAQVYSYIGSIFDPKASDHLQRLQRMDPINVETILMLMKNLSINLVSSEFEDHRRLLSSCSIGVENNSMGSTISSA